MTARIEVVPEALSGQRLDRVVAMVTGVSRADAAELVGAGAVRVGGEVRTVGAGRLAEGEVLAIDLPADESVALLADPTVAVTVVHADPDVIVVDKGPGLVVHPGAGNTERTMAHGLLARFPELAGVGAPDRPGIVHRLDKGTSGLLVVARSPRAYDSLVAQLADHAVARHYLALGWDRAESAQGLIDAPIGRSNQDPTRMAVSNRGRPARTRYQVVATYDQPTPTTLFECRLETGRTHQVRVHLAAIGHPVVGDSRYGGARQTLSAGRPFLHATTLGFQHPTSGQWMSFDSPLPPDLEAIRSTLC